MQAVLTTPCGLVGELYYLRKLCVYNLTYYSLGDGKSHCHVCDETQGQLGSCEVATCILKNSPSVCKSNRKIRVLTYYSDNCPGQNRNQYVETALLYTLSKVSNIEEINHKFLERGHSHMAYDSVHSAIEKAKKHTSVYLPSQWSTVISMVRKKHPHVVIPLKFDAIGNFKLFTSQCCPNMKVTTEGIKVNWLNIKWIQVKKEFPRSVFVNYSFSQEGFMEICVEKKSKSRSMWLECVPPLYEEKQPISKAKKKDLL